MIVTTLLLPLATTAIAFYIYLTLVPSAKTHFLVPKGFFEPKASSKTKNILLVVAHPDDECMFFGPTVVHLTREAGVVVHAVSVSNGNFDGLGAVRQKEFVESCKALGIQPENVVVLDDEKMQDGMKVWWKEEDVARVVQPLIITFDKYGISGHPNHRALYTGVKHVVAQHQKIKAFALISVPLLRKFISIFDLFPTFLIHFRHTLKNRKKLLETQNAAEVRSILMSKLRKERVLFLGTPGDVWGARKAMACHKSQMVWFRHLYLVFSRYMVINELEEI
ncbi:LmbE-like protein [Rhizoclosmatium globosum]|uniref:N-acetylglucosaminylphosphatidylinositol deacetylase n=1 Tax=Rhizoclosmatium globosum TaxID=329046 RepID=A0A1Y2CP47_9FUNG|nr:LmbE-like protein [Rhizoclosmatium globosum]|eukprot:ORY48095.1 LmbE-like protein [Rhizoclosmatium globosum]